MNAEALITLLVILDIGITLVNVAILGLGVKLYTDQSKQALLRERK